MGRIGAGLPQQGQWRNGFDLADVDGDGAIDLVHGPPRKGNRRPAIFRGDGQGGFARWKEVLLPELPYDYGDAAAADFDGDGRVDLAFAVHLREILILLANGPGDFRRDPTFRMVPGLSTRAIEVADWNGDGRPDLLALSEGPLLSATGQGGIEHVGLAIFLNEVESGWRGLTRPSRVFGDTLALGDLNGDGRPDALTSAHVMSFRRILHLGEGGAGWTEQEVPLPDRSTVDAVAVADFDGDGRDEGVVAYSRSTGMGRWQRGLVLFKMSQDGGLDSVPIPRDPDGPAFRALATGDLQGDGAPDLVGLDREGRILVWVGDGQGQLRRAKLRGLEGAGEGCRGTHVRLADLDGDGDDEVIAAFASEPEADLCRTGGSLRAWRLVTTRNR